MSFREMFAGTFGGSTAANFGVPSSGGSPGIPGPGQLQPNSRAANVAAGMDYQLLPAYPPFVRLSTSSSVAYFVRFRTFIFHGNGTAANTTAQQQMSFSVPTIIIARTAAAILADAAALPVGRGSLDIFTFQLFRAGSNSDMIDAGAGGTATAPNVLTLGSAILGTAAQPALIPGNGLFVDTGSFLLASCTNLIANALVHVTLWCLEEYGPARG